MTSLNSSVNNLKYCTIFGKKSKRLSATNVLRYVCYANQICCDIGNGCCPSRSIRYYENWCFWIFVFVMVLGCLLLYYYCKKLEKQRRINVGNEENSPPRLRSVEPDNVDHLLETLILNYRYRLASEQNQPTGNIDETKILGTVDSPPQYTDALNMPKPQRPEIVITTITESNSGGDASYTVIHNNNGENPENDDFAVIDIIDDGDVPSYEDAIREI